VRAVHAGVVDQHVDRTLVVLDVRGRRRDRMVVRDVDLDEAGSERVGCGLAALTVAGADDHGLTECDEPAGGLVAEPLVGSGDEGDGHVDEDRSRSSP
jgi:hypothetical protein